MNLFVTFSILIFSWSIDGTDPEVQRGIRLIFITVHALLAVVFAYVFYLIWKRGDKERVVYKDPMSDEETVKEVWSYDVMKLRELCITKIGLAAALSSLISYRYPHIGFPLLMQCIMNPSQFYKSELFQCYVLHREVAPRPWEEPQMWLQKLWAEGSRQSDEFLSSNTLSGRKETGGGNSGSGGGRRGNAKKLTT